MSVSLSDKLVVGVSSRALFDLEEENKIFEEQGVEAYSKYQKEHENDVLKPGVAFHLVKALLNLKLEDKSLVEVIIMSKNSSETSLRIFNSVKHYNLNITRAALVSGTPIHPYLNVFKTDLFLSANESDVQEAINANIAAGLICNCSSLPINSDETIEQIRIAFDGDAVIFSDESEKIFKAEGLEAFTKHEEENAKNPLPEGPFAKLLKTISAVQKQFTNDKTKPIRTALVTARAAPAHERVIRTLQAWGVTIDEAFFLGGLKKSDVIKVFDAHIFFDDQDIHLEPASEVVPSAKVLYKTK